MIFELQIYRGIGPVLFGMSREVVRAVMPTPFREFVKVEDYRVDDFRDPGFHVHYNEDGKCEAIEAYRPGALTLNGLGLAGTNLLTTIEQLRAIDANVRQDGSQWVFFGLGISVWSPGDPDDPTETAAAVMAFRRDYFPKG